MAKPKPDLRSMCLAARDGDHSAAKAVLRLYGFDALATEIKRGNPFAPRVARQIGALTSHIGTDGKPICCGWAYHRAGARAP